MRRHAAALVIFPCRGVSLISQEALFIPDKAVTGTTVTLSKSISALQLQQKENGDGAQLGLLSQLGRGTVLVVCGTGFDERTVKVRVNDRFYFVFAQDVGFATLLKR